MTSDGANWNIHPGGGDIVTMDSSNVNLDR